MVLSFFYVIIYIICGVFVILIFALLFWLSACGLMAFHNDISILSKQTMYSLILVINQLNAQNRIL